MTYQEFNYIYYKFTQKEKEIRPMDRIATNDYELKEFVEFAISKKHKDYHYSIWSFFIPYSKSFLYDS